MFEFLRDIMRDGEENPEYPNVRFPVAPDDVLAAEERIGAEFPVQLAAFFKEIGCGFLTQAVSVRDSDSHMNCINRFLDPDEVADLVLGEDPDVSPSEGFERGEFPFFDLGDRLYLVIRPTDALPNQVCWPYGEMISVDLVTFASELSKNPIFYQPRKGDATRFFP